MTKFVVVFIQVLGGLLQWCILLQVLLSWFRPAATNRFYAFLLSIVAPVYQLIGKVVPPLGPLDIRPLIALFLVQLAVPFVVSFIAGA